MTELQRGFLNPLRVENIDACNWRLLEDFGWRGSQDDIFTVNKGETTDFATVPWWSQAITPRTGTWTKAAVLHDKMCNQLNSYYQLQTSFERLVRSGYNFSRSAIVEPVEPVFSSIDTDAIFRKNAREDGTDRVRSEILWLGVRLGALANPARRKNWISTAPRVIGDLVLLLAFLYLCTFIILWIAHSIL